MPTMHRNNQCSILICLGLGMLSAFLISIQYTVIDLKYEVERLRKTKMLKQHETDEDQSTDNTREEGFIYKQSSGNSIRRTFMDSQVNSIFLLGAVGKNSSPTAEWDQFAVYGQWYDAHKFKVHSLRCCFKYSDGVVTETPIAGFDQPSYSGFKTARLRLWHSTCNNPQRKHYSTPSLISIARNCSCSSPSVNYIQPYLTLQRPPEHITVTTKFAYGNINPETVVSYLETVRYLGIDKVVTYVIDSLNPTAERILRHYASSGLVEYHNLELADRTVPRPFNSPQYISDEWLVMRDALERNIGSEYFGIFDMDEYLIPSRNRTYKQLLRSLRRQFPRASNFVFTNKHFLTNYNDWTSKRFCTLFERHIKTPPHEFDYNLIDKKFISITSRVKTSSIRNHDVISLDGYVQQVCPKEEAYVRHFGPCYRKFSNRNVCNSPRRWITDHSTAEWAKHTIEETVLRTLKMFLT